MKKLIRPVYILLFATLPQSFLLGYLLFTVGISNIRQAILLLSLLIVFNASFTVYALLNHKKEAADARVLFLLSAAYALLGGAGMFLLKGFSPPSAFASPSLVFAALCMASVLYGILGGTGLTTPPDRNYSLAGYGSWRLTFLAE